MYKVVLLVSFDSHIAKVIKIFKLKFIEKSFQWISQIWRILASMLYLLFCAGKKTPCVRALQITEGGV